eukprot:1022144-Alexandrium_andersonii.AAC.1
MATLRDARGGQLATSRARAALQRLVGPPSGQVRLDRSWCPRGGVTRPGCRPRAAGLLLKLSKGL